MRLGTKPFTGIVLQGDSGSVIWFGTDGSTDEGVCLQAPAAMDVQPDLKDPGTKGCVLELARQVWDDPTLYVQSHQDESGETTWEVRTPGVYGSLDRSNGDHPTEGEALMACLWFAEEPSQKLRLSNLRHYSKE